MGDNPRNPHFTPALDGNGTEIRFYA
jgi:hypothetical protein